MHVQWSPTSFRPRRTLQLSFLHAAHRIQWLKRNQWKRSHALDARNSSNSIVLDFEKFAAHLCATRYRLGSNEPNNWIYRRTWLDCYCRWRHRSRTEPLIFTLSNLTKLVCGETHSVSRRKIGPMNIVDSICPSYVFVLLSSLESIYCCSSALGLSASNITWQMPDC